MIKLNKRKKNLQSLQILIQLYHLWERLNPHKEFYLVILLGKPSI